MLREEMKRMSAARGARFAWSAAAAMLLATVCGCGGSPTASYGTITTIAGNTTHGYTGDGGPATSAELNAPVCVAVDGAGNVFIGDATSNVVRRVSTGGTITTYAGTGTAGFSGDGGPATAATLQHPNGCAVDAAGNLYIADTGNSAVRRVTAATGVINTVAGIGLAGFAGDGGVATAAVLNNPYGVAVDTSGNVYIADTSNQRIRKVTGGIITTIAGNGVAAYGGDGGAATAGSLYNPEGLVVSSAGDVYVAEEGNSVVRKIAAGGTLTTIAGNDIYGFGGDGSSATSAHLDGPAAVALGPGGLVFFADSGNDRIRRVNADGTIQTVAGSGDEGYNGDNQAATTAQLSNPRGLTFNAAGAMFIADTNNALVRKVQ